MVGVILKPWKSQKSLCFLCMVFFWCCYWNSVYYMVSHSVKINSSKKCFLLYSLGVCNTNVYSSHVVLQTFVRGMFLRVLKLPLMLIRVLFSSLSKIKHGSALEWQQYLYRSLRKINNCILNNRNVGWTKCWVSVKHLGLSVSSFHHIIFALYN